MREPLQRALDAFDDIERTASLPLPLQRIDPRAKIVVTALYLAMMLSLPLSQLSRIALYSLFPFVAAAMGGMNYAVLFRRSLVVLPFVAFVGVFEIFYGRAPVFSVGPVVVTEGWIRFGSLSLRGLLSVQALSVLVASTGSFRLCRGMQRLGMPRLLTLQMFFVLRYLRLLVEQALTLKRARDARGFGRSSYPLGLWAVSVGQLLVRTIDRAGRIDRAMRSRGFTGRIPASTFDREVPWSRNDTLFLLGWGVLFVSMRFFAPSDYLALLLFR